MNYKMAFSVSENQCTSVDLKGEILVYSEVDIE